MRFFLSILVFLSFAFTALAAPVYLTSMTIQPGKTSTRLTLTLSDKTAGKVKFVPPDRVVVDLENTKNAFKITNARLGGSNIVSMTSETSPQGTQLILFVKDKVKWTVRFLPPEKNSPVRLEITIISVAPNIKQATFPVHMNQHVAAAEDHLQPEYIIGRARLETMPPPKDNSIFTVVIDAGHGGHDPGAIGKGGIQEKAIVLAIAKKLAAQINQTKHMRAVLTREGDYYLPLRQRMDFARKSNANLFIAIHADAYFNNNVMGASVYALSQHGATSEAARWLAKKDNYSELDGVELNSLKDRSSLLRFVLIDLAQTSSIRDSIRLGNAVLHSLDDFSSMHHTRVEQAPFMVLKSPDIPSILIETGFITNPYEEQRLKEDRYQQRIATAIWQGIHRYVKEYTMLGN